MTVDVSKLLSNAVIIGAVAFGAKLLFDIKGDVSALNVRSNVTETRLEKIASVLPDLKIRISQDEIIKPFDGVYFTFSPQEDGENWRAVSGIYKPAAGKMTVVYSFEKDKEEAEKTLSRFYGSTMPNDSISDVLKFRNLQEHSAVTGNNSWISEKINIDGSHIYTYSRKPSGNEDLILSRWKKYNYHSFELTLDEKVGTWLEIAKKLSYITENVEKQLAIEAKNTNLDSGSKESEG